MDKSEIRIKGIPLKKEELFYQSLYGEELKIRSYTFDFDNLIQEDFDFVVNILQKHYNLDDDYRVAIISIFQRYLFFTNYVNISEDGKWVAKENNEISRKRNRKFNIETLYYNEIFNPQKSLQRHTKEKIIEKANKILNNFTTIYLKDLKNALKDKNNIIDLIELSTLSYKFILQFYPGEELYFGFMENLDIKIEAFYKWLITNKKKITNYDVQAKRTEVLLDPVDTLLRSSEFDAIIEDVLNFLLSTNDEDLIDNELLNFDRFIEKRPTAIAELNSVLTRLINYLEIKKKNSRSKENISWLNEKLELIYGVLDSDPETKINRTPDVYFIFVSKDEVYQKIFLETEKIVSNYFRILAKFIFDELCNSEKLTKFEKRVFIASHIGIPIIGRKTPYTDPLLIQYLMHSESAFIYFMESVIIQTHEWKDLFDFNLLYFLGFCKFYAFWHEIVKEVESVQKSDKEYRLHKISFPEEVDLPSVSDRNDLDSNNDSNPRNDEGALFEEDEEQEINVRQGKQKDIIKAREKIYSSFEFEIYDLLHEALTDEQFKIFTKHVFEKMSFTDIALELGVTVANISKHFNKAKKKLATNDKILDLMQFKY